MMFKILLRTTLLSAIFIGIFSSCISEPEDPEAVSGEYYNWKVTEQPEVVWNHDYNKTLVTKMFLCERNGSGEVEKVYADFETALNNIAQLDAITLGIPKIVYLVGWQYNGHDSKYPAWHEVNPALKRQQDSTALQSLKWLIKSAKDHNTTVSLHINMIDAYEESPLWETYLEKDIVAKDAAGNPIPGEVFYGMQSYQLSYAREWESGFAQKRIDELFQLLPELQESGTIHVDAFHSVKPSEPDSLISPYLGYSIEKELQAQRKIIRYFRKKGVDFTSEAGIYWLRKDPFLGLQALPWHYTEKNYRDQEWIGKSGNFRELPPALSAHTPMQAEAEMKRGEEGFADLTQQVALQLVPWYYKRNTDVSRFSNAVLLDDIVVAPVLWTQGTILAYSRNIPINIPGFRLPSSWGEIAALQLAELTPQGPVVVDILAVSPGIEGGHFTDIDLPAGRVFLLKVVNTQP